MTKLDNQQEYHSQLVSTPADLDMNIDHTMEDHDLLLHHVAGHDPELYALDCCLSEMQWA